MRVSLVSVLCVLIASAIAACAQEQIAAGGVQSSLQIPFSIDQAIEYVSRPGSGFGNMSPSELQVDYRLMGLIHRANYRFVEEHAPAWEHCMLDDRRNIYARLCAAYFLLERHKEAQEFIEGELASNDLRHRYNAAKVLQLHVGRDPSRTWGVNLLVRLLADGSLDGSGVHSSPGGEFPNRDRDDIMLTPMDDICWDLGFMKEKKAVPALISVLQRVSKTSGAAFALGEIGDKRANPALLKVLKDRSGYEHREITALGKLKASEAAPILITRLGHPETTFSGLDVIETRAILEALLDIGDKQAITPIEAYLKGDFPNESKAIARRVLVQLDSEDPVQSLLALLKAETDEPERSDIIAALAKNRDERVVKELLAIAGTSDSAYMRREAIFALREIHSKQSLLALASLLDMTFSKDLKAQWGWKVAPDFPKYFPETIALCLREATNEDFGQNRANWEAWIAKNVQADPPMDHPKTRP